MTQAQCGPGHGRPGSAGDSESLAAAAQAASEAEPPPDPCRRGTVTVDSESRARVAGPRRWAGKAGPAADHGPMIGRPSHHDQQIQITLFKLAIIGYYCVPIIANNEQ
jgi:hypothetical protein